MPDNISNPGHLEIAALAALAAVALSYSAAAQPVTRSVSQIPDGILQTPHRIEQIAGDLRVPWALTFLPDGRIMFTEREGRVRLIARGELLGTPALSIKVPQGTTMGVLGIALDPRFAQNNLVYLAYNYEVTPTPEDKDPPFRLRVARYRLQGNTLIEPRVLIEDIPAAGNHTGSRLVFGPQDGKLYVTTGDADRPLSSERLDRLAGKILRLNPDGSVPPDNPFAGQPGARPEIWSYGHRNPQGLVFEPLTGRLLETEHGPFNGDEINWIEKGRNYGWPTIDHARTQPGREAPVLEFSPSIAPGEALFYRGKAFPELRGQLLVAALRGQGVLRIEHKNGKLGAVERLFRRQFGRIRSLTESPEGYLYLTTSIEPEQGELKSPYDLVFRIVPAGVTPSRYPALTPAVAGPDDTPSENAAVIRNVLTSKNVCGSCHEGPAATDVVTRVMSLIDKNCASCHGVGMAGGVTAPGYSSGRWQPTSEEAALRRIISNGLAERGMPAYPQLEPKEVDALAHSLREMSRWRARWPH